MRWRLILGEFGPEFIYIKGKKNIVADTLNRMDVTEELADVGLLQELFKFMSEDVVDGIIPVTYKNICLSAKIQTVG